MVKLERFGGKVCIRLSATVDANDPELEAAATILGEELIEELEARFPPRRKVASLASAMLHEEREREREPWSPGDPEAA